LITATRGMKSRNGGTDQTCHDIIDTLIVTT
jgi:hypothetical protein